MKKGTDSIKSDGCRSYRMRLEMEHTSVTSKSVDFALRPAGLASYGGG